MAERELAIRDNRRKAIVALRAEKRPKSLGMLYDRNTGCYCALGYMGAAVGIDAAAQPLVSDIYDRIDTAFGMSMMMSSDVVRLSDHTDSTLADIALFLASEWDMKGDAAG